MAKFKVGDIVKVIGNSVSHSYKIGQKYKINCAYNSEYNWQLQDMETGKKPGSYIVEKDMELIHKTRAEFAEYLKAEVLPEGEAKLAALTKEIEELKSRIERYEKFESAEAEAAHLISQIFKTGGDEGAILDVLKTTKVLNGKEDF